MDNVEGQIKSSLTPNETFFFLRSNSMLDGATDNFRGDFFSLHIPPSPGSGLYRI